MSEQQTLILIHTKPMGGDHEVSVQAKPTANGNLSFTFQSIRHILKPDGSILWCVTYANQRPSWEASPNLRVAGG